MEGYSNYQWHYASTAAPAPQPTIISPYERLKAAIAQAHPATAEHSVRVRICATKLGRACGLSGQDLTTLTIAAEVHDIGKLRVPHSVLDKSGPLSDSEWLIIRKHPRWGAEMVRAAFPERPDVANCVINHHERLDGSGYPYGLAGSQIPLLSRIVSIADTYVALTEARQFRPAKDPLSALAVMYDEERGKYDEALLGILSRML